MMRACEWDDSTVSYKDTYSVVSFTDVPDICAAFKLRDEFCELEVSYMEQIKPIN